MADQSNILTKYQVNELSKRVDNLDSRITLLMENHIPHLKEDVLSLKTRINVMTAINIAGIAAGIIIAKLLT